MTKNLDTAKLWYEKSIAQGDVFAMYGLGHLLYIEKQYAEALPMLQRAVASGHVSSTVLIAKMHLNGFGVEKNPSEGLEWLLRGATAGDAEAQWMYGRRLFFGIDVTEDERVGFSWMLKAAENGYVDALNTVGKSLINGWGVSHDLGAGLKWFGIGVSKGDLDCIASMGHYYQYGIPMRKENGKTVFFPEKLGEAVRLYRMGAEKGHVDCEYRLGNCFYRGDSGWSTSIVRKGGEEESLAKADTIEKNYDEAVRWYRLAATHGSAPAQCALGRCYARGHGTPVDKAEAKIWYKKAIAGGDKDAASEMRQEIGGCCCCC